MKPPINDAAPLAGGAGVNDSNTHPDHNAVDRRHPPPCDIADDVMPPCYTAAVIAAATEYAARGWSVLPMKADKHPAVTTWKARQEIAAKPADVASWFTRAKAHGVGIVLGAVSGHLWVRDFDDGNAYRRWAASHPELAATLPTVTTSRGFHVYGCWKGIKTVTMPDGELRSNGVYVVAPPTRHASGVFYEWLVPVPAAGVPEVDPVAAGLTGGGSEPAASATERTERTEAAESTERSEQSEVTEDTESTEAMSARLRNENRAAIESAIARTLPPAHGKRNAHVFRLARALKAIPALFAVPSHRTVVLRPIVKEWHERALVNILTKDWGTTWGDFGHAWAKVRTPEGADVLGGLLATARQATAPQWAADYSHSAKLLACLCRELQRYTDPSGKAPFFLSCVKTGECVGADKGTAWRWMTAFQTDGALVVSTLGKPGRATRWRYVARDLQL